MPGRPFHPNEISAGGAVVRPAQSGFEVCLISDGRYWGLPKGNVGSGESPEDAALREIAEETGIPRHALRPLGSLPASEYVYRRRDTGRLIHKRVHFFLVEAPAETPLQPDPAEITDAAWLSFDDASSRASFRDTVRAIDAARKLLTTGDPSRAGDTRRAH